MEAPLADEVHNHSCPSRLSWCTWIPFLFGFCTLLRLYDISPYLPHDDSHVDKLGTMRLSSCWLYVTFICWRIFIFLDPALCRAVWWYGLFFNLWSEVRESVPTFVYFFAEMYAGWVHTSNRCGWILFYMFIRLVRSRLVKVQSPQWR